jgi:hypothetical protein
MDLDRFDVARLLAARAARESAPDAVAEATALIAKLVEDIRGFFYPKQRAYFRSPAKRKATKKTRRSGATAGGCRELLGRSLEQPNHRATYITGKLKDARKRAWANDTKTGFVDIIRQKGKRLRQAGVEAWDLAGVTAWIRKGELIVDFSNGSQIDLFGADQEGVADRLRGIAKDVFWIDEAQDLPTLDDFYKSVIVPAMQDFAAECWLTGTPGKDCVGLFYEVTKEEEEDRAKGWEVHRIAAVDNPFFGRVVWEAGEWFVEDNIFGKPGSDRTTHTWKRELRPATDDMPETWVDVIETDAHRWGPFASEAECEAIAIKVRWERSAGEAIRENGWSTDDPDLLREYFARWIKDDARYVYALHAVPEHEIVYAPVRLAPDGFLDLRAAMADLPNFGKIDYFTATGADLGTRAAFAMVTWAWSLHDPILYEVGSWKRSGLDYDEMALWLNAARSQIVISLITADAGGGGKPAVMGWSKKWLARYSIPIQEATKHHKSSLAIKQMNNDIRRGFVKLRKDSVIMNEWKVHRWKPLRSSEGKEIEDSTPRDASDAGLYGHRESYHHRFREEPPKIVAGTPAYVLREERELEDVALDFHYDS